MLLPSAVLVMLIGFATWLGFLSAPVPAGVIIAIGAGVGLLSALFVRYFHNRSVNLMIVAASGLIALLATYLGGVYAAFLSMVVVLVISAAPNAYRVMAGYSMSALMGFTLLLNESFNPSPESLQMLTTLAVIPYPLALLFNTSVPADSARLKAFQALMLLGLSGRLWLVLNEGLEVNNYGLGALGAAVVFAITWKLRRIPLPLGIGFLSFFLGLALAKYSSIRRAK